MPHPTRALINLEALKHNIAVIRSLVPASADICVPVKADAYGHGAVPCAKAVLEAGAAFLGVATVAEGEELRSAGITSPILLFGPPLPEEVPSLVYANLSPFLFDTERITQVGKTASSLGKTIDVHLKVDTGMHRVGCPPEEAPALARLITDTPGVRLAGMSTHFAASDSGLPEDKDYTALQFSRFASVVDAVRSTGIPPGLCHAANSGAVMAHPGEFSLDLVRTGIAAYGYFSAPGIPPETALAFSRLVPVMTLVSRITFIKTVDKAETVSYGRRWKAPSPTRVATVPVGYADGLTRRLSGKGFCVGVGGASCPVIGSICMDQCLVNVDGVPDAAVGNEVVIFGDKKRGAVMEASVIAELTDTISYEILTAITKRVPREYV